MTADTEQMWLLDLRPSVPTRHERRSALTRIRRSPAAAHLRAATRAVFWPTAIGAGVILAFVVLAALQQIAPSVVIR